MVQDTQPISSSAPCHEAKKVSSITIGLFSYYLHNELALCLLPHFFFSNDVICSYLVWCWVEVLSSMLLCTRHTCIYSEIFMCSAYQNWVT